MKKYIFLMFFGLTVISFVSTAIPKESHPKKMKPALLVIDIQNEYLKYSSDKEKQIGMMYINAAIALFRKYDFPVILVYHHDSEWGPEVDSEAFQFPTTVAIKDSDPKIIKNYPSAFKKTELQKMLQKKGCNTLFLCGLSAVGCVLATYHSAMDLDYDVFMLKNALLSHKDEYTDFIEEIFDALGYSALEVMLKNVEK